MGVWYNNKNNGTIIMISSITFTDILEIIASLISVCGIVTAPLAWIIRSSVTQMKDSNNKLKNEVKDANNLLSTKMTEDMISLRDNSELGMERLRTHIDNRIDNLAENVDSKNKALQDMFTFEVKNLRAADESFRSELDATKDKYHVLNQKFMEYKLEVEKSKNSIN